MSRIQSNLSKDTNEDMLSILHKLEFGDTAQLHKPSNLKLIYYPIFVLLLLGISYIAVQNLSTDKPTEVGVIVIPQDTSSSGVALAPLLEVSGFVVAPESTTVSANVTGRVTGISVELGDLVQAGQAVATLDDRQAKIELNTFETKLKSQLSLREVRLEDLALTQASGERAKRLFENQLISNEAYEQVLSQVISKKIAIIQLEQSIDELKNAILQTQLYLDDLVIRSPFSGIVTAMSANVGEIISPASAGGTFTRSGICTITDLSSLEFHFDVNERFLSQVFSSDSIRVSFTSQPDLLVEAKIKQIAPITDSQTGTVIVITEPVEQVNTINPGATVTGVFTKKPDHLKDAPRAIVIPNSAVHFIDGKTYVFVEENGVARLRLVDARQNANDDYLLTDVPQRLTVIASSTSPLTDGQTITIKR
ncbi:MULTISPECIES: efflux RND transporter periplasmic adaptor subunit [Pseudoalteromonas]|uniref:efflux RND transporter periplasmic adaptor subunit n=1 Tax=Pseudoalteromonas TaxID=53246 RepID=UPI0007861F0E|nr:MULTISPECIES: efflux RND transporter periplasmic adaptor subunit [Pseudoalteromonas]MCO7205803.1 efflux RND transporter periplasmic adaptor subunit [Pseudoalteromonas sp. CnMc7-37]RZF81974.1 efflux RND transporter periplasmic adaptor subunit [Pseudoalteromonas sp. CO109Y]TMO32262.1 efflux RND transporter periplasmic adaptor subunit [Pseudoalteromonas sp. S4491]TMO40125.1 efflux RND transporter periplasmic adaptor subunit [Pseudoalteromonas sp. S4488]